MLMNLTDQHHRVHDYLRISLTERCNLRCIYCMPEEGIKLRPKSEFMSYQEVMEIAGVFVSLGIHKIRLTGGEPLVRNDTHDIIKGLSKLPVELAITTNGILADEYINTFIASRLRSINISLDSLRPEQFEKITRRNYYARVMHNIELLLQNNFHVKINVVVIKGVNDSEICDFVSWTRNKNVHIRFIEFMPFNGNNWLTGKVVSFNEILQKVTSVYGNDVIKIADGVNDTAKNYAIRNHTGTFAVISSVTNPFCDTCNRIRLTADGKIKNCLFSAGETDLLAVIRKGNDIRPMIKESIWHKKALRGGMESPEDFGKQKNRTMVSIGG